VSRDRDRAADNWHGLRVPLPATVAALLLCGVWYVLNFRAGLVRQECDRDAKEAQAEQQQAGQKNSGR
jgi:hypothetical protein